MIDSLTTLSPLDGRYADKTAPLQHLMSEFGLIHYRVMVEIHWLIALANHPNITEVPPLNSDQTHFLQQIMDDFDLDDAKRVKEIEKTTNHDVKAVEYYLQEQFSKGPHLTTYSPFIHFACTSEDINNLAYALMLKKSRDEVLLPQLNQLTSVLDTMALNYAAIPMLSHTHGQPATPTTLGKELRNVERRLHHQTGRLQQVNMQGKFNGAVGNFNAHHIAYPDVNWPQMTQDFIESLGLTCNAYTTQIEPHDFIAELMHSIMRINTIFIDLSRDIWGYISLGYFNQIKIAGEVGSSTMPHKVNPIDFENAEGNAGLANAIAGHLADKLPISRWQRDLSDSTVLRNLGLVFGYSVITYASLQKGLSKLSVNETLLKSDLDDSWELLAEPVQTVLRRYGVADAYEQLKELTRGKRITSAEMQIFINGLNIPTDAKTQLLSLTPAKYIGYAVALAKKKH